MPSGSGSKKRKKVTFNQRRSCVRGGVVALPCKIVVAGSGQCQVEVAAKKRKGSNQPEVWQHE